jgi:hypothetical protein
MAAKIFLTLCASIVTVTGSRVFGSATQPARYAQPRNSSKLAGQIKPTGARRKSRTAAEVTHTHSTHAG